MRTPVLLLALGFALLMVPACGTVLTGVGVASRPEGLEFDLRGYRFLLRGVYQAEVGAVNVGDGVLYTVNDHEILLRTGGREVLLDGVAIDIEVAEVFEIARALESAPTADEADAEAKDEAERDGEAPPQAPAEAPKRPDVSEEKRDASRLP